MVLGIQWLATLGIIKWNFKSLRMEFSHSSRHYVLIGKKTRKVQMKLAKALMAATYLHMIKLIPQSVGHCFALEPIAAKLFRDELHSLLQLNQDVLQVTFIRGYL